MIPAGLYEKLPLVYAAAGVAALVLLGTDVLVIASALLLFTAAVLTYVKRRIHRAKTFAGRARSRARNSAARRRSIY